MKEFVTERRVEFVDTDMGGIVHFSRFFVFMETAEHRFRDSFGASVEMQLEGRRIGWPRVAATCEYRSPARFGDVLKIHVAVERTGEKSVTLAFRFTRDDEELATGRMTSVCCVLEPGQPVRPIPIPDFISDALRAGES